MNNTNAIVYIVNDYPMLRDAMSFLLSNEGFSVETYADIFTFLDNYRSEQIGCLLLDFDIPLFDSLELQVKLEEMEASLPIIYLTEPNEPRTIQAFKYSTVDFIEKPAADEQLLVSIKKAIKHHTQEIEVSSQKK